MNRTIKIYVDVIGSTIVDADVVGVDGTADIAVLRLRSPISGVVPLSLSTVQPERGDQAVLIGAPSGDMQSVSSAYIRDISFYGSSLLPTVMESILLDGSAIGGNSGGPLFNMKGDVIGVLSYGYNGTHGGTMNGAVPSWIVSTIVGDIIKNRKNYSYGSLGVKVSPLYIDDALFLRRNKVQGYMVIGFNRSTIASSLRLESGDILLSLILNGREYELGQLNSQSCIFSLIHMNAGKTITLKILRFEKEISITLTIPSATSTIPQNGFL